jgi:hypothetical protein
MCMHCSINRKDESADMVMFHTCHIENSDLGPDVEF